MACGITALVVCVVAGTAHAATDRGEILERLGAASLALGDYGEAARYLREALDAGRDHPELRYRLGFALAELDRCDEAIEELEIAMRDQRRARTALQLGRCYERIHKPGVAIHWLEDAVWVSTDLSPAERRDAYGTLGFLYSAEGQLARAAEAWQQRLSFDYDAETALRLARVRRLLGERAKAVEMLAAIPARDLPPAVDAVRLDELAELSRDQGQLERAVAALEAANAIEEAAHRHHRLGLLQRDLGRRAEALRHLERAHALAPADAEYTMALAYAYASADRRGEAARLFEAVVASEPERLGLYRELGYLHASQANTASAVEWFKKAIDNDDRDPRDARVRAVDRARLQNEIARMSPHFDVIASLTYRGATGQPTAGSGTLGGALPSQSGVEVSYQPPVIGFRDERIFQVFARLLWNFESGSFAIDGDSLQAGLGVRYKPLRTYNLFVSAERLIAVGDHAIDDWLLRALYSWQHHSVVPPEWSLWNYTTLFADAGYFVERGIWAVYGEARQGLTWRPATSFTVTPHVVADGRYQEAGGPTESFIEGGGGVGLRYSFRPSRYEGDRASIELLLQYKAGQFLGPGTGGNDTFHGPVVGMVLRF